MTTYGPQDRRRIQIAQMSGEDMCERKWISYAQKHNCSPDDICFIMSMSCTTLHAFHMDSECDMSLRKIALAEQQDRRKYRLPPEGCPYVDKLPEYEQKPKSKFLKNRKSTFTR